MMRGFEIISDKQWEEDLKTFPGGERAKKKEQNIPKRGTANSAGYDFFSPVHILVPPKRSVKIPTGIKAYMGSDEVLMIYPRSSIGFKTNIRLSNTVGIVDSDYYNNSENEGHIWIKFFNPTESGYAINVGDKIAQGIFIKYLTIDNENEIVEKRVGGLGSTGK